MAVIRESKLFTNLEKYSDVMVAVFIITIVGMMIIPLPTMLLDLLLTLNITLAVIIVMVAIYNIEPLDFSVFPSLLLIATLFRLALNVSSTRLILLEGHAGEVIAAFGNFVVGGNAVVGFIVFVILIIIQFIVITKGAERVAEVAARFTLDAMPGKQMSIDADLNAGLISDKDARERRSNIQREADFYGAMDGASKFVKGDAIAAIIIIVINIVGGFIIGMVQRDLDVLQALHTYTLLTVGEGLVNQIPALLISTATGIVVTRAASDSNLGSDLTRQLINNPRVFFIACGVLLLLGLIPGLPGIPFLTISLLTGVIGYALVKTQQTDVQTEMSQQEEIEKEEVRKPENIIALLQVDPMELEIGYSLIPLVDVSQGGDLLDRVVMIRRQCALELGLIVPTIRIRDNIQLKPSIYVIKLKGIEIARGELMLDHFLAMDSGAAFESVPGIETVEPAFGLPALWIQETYREQAELAGYTVVDPVSVLATHLTEIIRSHAAEILGRQEVQTLVESVKQNNAAVVEELTPNLLSIGEIQKILGNLLREKISIRDLVTIFETAADYAQLTKDTEILTEYVRHALSRQISRQFVNNNILTCLTVDPQLENMIVNSVQRTEQGSYVALEPKVVQAVITSLTNELSKLTNMGYQPVVLTNPGARLYFRKLTERVAPNLTVLSYAELDPKAEVQALGMVKL
ncbi:Flagellar biosynthesis protein FlhA [Sporomusa ovata DSM 2662]|uniref:Flagellar biosynthesis protein FlhA n=1 Tax=Sporomusa ovata TaxID=2378 RepID=A0A0U1KVP0_9FIRM|nr:flagellar biosynthesis protein FlhA [Sporomusa ovata]EQB29452.1 flagellar biosynthesis protein FlhA [Sporomusa ovata DSM 2662]CQR71502.1 Flagellar biosynthesis protein FlhA [Sporomusa ovata]